MCFSVTPSSAGAYLPRVRAPPAPTTLWHIAQLVRNSSLPSARRASSPTTWRYSSAGIAGPGPSEATYADRSATSCSENLTSLAGACGAVASIGIRPVPTWKSVAAAPTPIRLGPAEPPWPAGPWQVEQLAWKSRSPASASPVAVVDASASCGRGDRVRAAGDQQAEQQQHDPGQRVAPSGGECLHDKSLVSGAFMVSSGPRGPTDALT